MAIRGCITLLMHVTTTDEDGRLTPEERFGRQVRAQREAVGLSQTELADRATVRGVALTQTLVSRIEQGRRPLRLNEAAVVAGVLDMDLGDAVSRAADPRPPSEAERVEESTWRDLQDAARTATTRATAFTEARRALWEAVHGGGTDGHAWRLAFEAVPEEDRPPRSVEPIFAMFDRAATALGGWYPPELDELYGGPDK